MSSPFGRQLRRRARHNHRRRYWEQIDRETYTCPGCDRAAHGPGDGFEVHHRDGDPLNGHPLNLVALCHHCHVQVHRQANIQRHLDQWKSDAPVHTSESASGSNQRHTVYSWSVMGAEGVSAGD